MPIRTYESDNVDGQANEESEVARFSVLYAKSSTRKHKKWEADGVLICCEGSAVLKSEDEKDIICRSTSIKKIDELESGKIIAMGSWEVQIQDRIDSTAGFAPPIVTPRPVVEEKSPFRPTLSLQRQPCSSFSFPLISRPSVTATPSFGSRIATPVFVPADNRKRPLLDVTPHPTQPGLKKVGSKRGFNSPLLNAEEFSTPSFVINESEVGEFGAAPIQVDAKFSRFLRPHQKEGVQFIYDRLKNGQGGAILADEMGLGKSVQTIAAAWTIMRNNNKNSRKLITPLKCLLVVPSSLVNNWKNEFRKWFRADGNPAIAMRKASDIDTYVCASSYSPFLIISYEMASRYSEKLANVRFDMIVCDEGHRLKNLNGKLRVALNSLNIPRRLVLTGTPFQNDFDEFFSILDFVLPGQFGTATQFSKLMRQNDDEMNRRIIECMLRRTSDVNISHLPERHEYVLFCRPSSLQRKVQEAICDLMLTDPFVLIGLLRKLASHPSILASDVSNRIENGQAQFTSIIRSFPANFSPRIKQSGKLAVVLNLLPAFVEAEERTVIVSNYTTTLDMLQTLCMNLQLRIFRLDGSVQVQDRQRLVDEFNAVAEPDAVFLLSTKAGGVGLNLIGASRLILFDSDWNPANDLQAMARIWRDGQKKPCHIYRLVTTGTIEEKILQRQIYKTGLTAVIDVMESSVGDGPTKLSAKEREDIFEVRETECDTHDKCGCDCDGDGLLPDERDLDDEGDISPETDQVAVDKKGSNSSLKDSDDDQDFDDEEEDEEVNTTIESQEDIFADPPNVDKKAPVKENDENVDCFDSQDLIKDEDDDFVVVNVEKKTSQVEDVGEEDEEELEAKQTSLAELSRWRHFSPKHAATWAHLVKNAGLARIDDENEDGTEGLGEITFALQRTSKF